MTKAPVPSDPSIPSTLRASVLDKLTRLFLLVGLVAAGIACVRNLQIGASPWKVWPSLTGIAIVGTLQRFHTRIPERTRSWFVVGALVLVGANSIRLYGVSAPGSFLIPAGIVLCWLLLGGRAAVAMFATSSILFVLAAASVLRHGAVSDIMRSGRSSTPIFWLNLLIVQVFVGGVLVMTIRTLAGLMVVERSNSLKAAERFDGILEGIRDAIVVVDMDSGVVERANPAAERMFGHSHGAFRDVSLGSHIDPDRNWKDSPFASRPTPTGTSSFRWLCAREGGDRFWTEVTARQLDGTDRGLLLATFRDIESTVQEEDELAVLNRGLEELVVSRTEALERSRIELEYIALAISDDLKRPLSRIHGGVQRLKEHQGNRLDAEGSQYLNRVESGAERMDVLIEALLGLSSINDRPSFAVTVDMDRAARTCCQELESIRKNGIPTVDRIRWEVSQLPPCTTDAGLVGQIWANLVSNAFKFTAGKPGAFVRIGHLERPDGIWYEVADNGIGFDMSQAGKLYKIFQRLHADGPEGLGIGLATTKRILDRLGGEIEAEGRPGEGATFRFRPYAPKSGDKA